MKLLSQIILRLSIVLLVILSVWGTLFYFSMVDEINDEVDDALEEYSEQLISRSLAGIDMPTADDGTNNSYHISEVSNDYAKNHTQLSYKDVMVYVNTKDETEPARVMTTIFQDSAGQYYELTVSTPTIEKHDLTEAILYWSIFLYVALLIIILFVNVWVYYGSLKPLHTLLRWFDGYTIGVSNAPLHNETKIVEFQKLNAAVVRSTQRSEQIFEQQKQFIGNASHEIQTPLAICQNRLDMLLETELSEEQMGEVLKTQHTLAHIGRLNKSLLFLSKIDNRQFVESSQVNINAVAKELLADFKDAYSYKNINISCAETGQFIRNMNETLATALISNLLKNAFVHTAQAGLINMSLSDNTFEIKNSGTAPLDKEHIFERFYQGSKKEGSTGLGLAIAEAICRTYNLSISYSYTDNMHCFRVF